MKWFRVWLGEIKSYEVVKQTEKQLIYLDPRYAKQEQRAAKHSQYEDWFPTFEEARQFIIDQAKTRIDHHHAHIAQLEKQIEKTKALTGPSK